jgi:murein DD-endopeptidase MepM/ murein hydrolase activator NlpD
MPIWDIKWSKMRYILVFFMMMHGLNAAHVMKKEWKKGQTFSQYLESHEIPFSMLSSISNDDLKFLSDINNNYPLYELTNEQGQLLQALIPISEVMQIHLTKNKHNNRYEYDITPIEYEKKEYFAKVIVESNPYSDTLKTVQSKKVAKRLSLALKSAINSKKFRKGNEINFIYTQHTRVGKPYLMPDIKATRVQMGKDEKFVYTDEDGYGFIQTGKNIAETIKGKKKVTYSKRVFVNKANSMFGMPLRHVRITSSFSYRRYHPILKRYRPHHGTDFGARRGTPLLAVNAGRVSFSGRMGGYGKVVKIRHGGGYESLYAHQSRTRVKRGQRVKKGQVIGYAGSTGRSTGPHLHFGLKKRGRWVNPMQVLRKKSIKISVMKKFTKYKDVLTTRYRTVAIKGLKENKAKLLKYIKNGINTYVWEGLDNGE